MKFRVPTTYKKEIPLTPILELDGFSYYEGNINRKDWYIEPLEYLPTETDITFVFSGKYFLEKGQPYNYTVEVYSDIYLRKPLALENSYYLVEITSKTHSLLVPVVFRNSNSSRMKLTFLFPGVYKVTKVYSIVPNAFTIKERIFHSLATKTEVKFWIRPTHKFFVLDYTIQDAINLLQNSSSTATSDSTNTASRG